MKQRTGFSVKAHMPQACEAQRAATQKDRKPAEAKK
ncbi:hypothetical protein IWX58_001556 [Rubrivivax gelatinosus]|nr:hypothetical protein [Rubrivivax gelatinosus]